MQHIRSHKLSVILLALLFTAFSNLMYSTHRVAASTPSFAYVANTFSNDVSVIDVASNTVVATVPVGSSPGGVAITPDGAFAYVTNSGSDNVSVIETAGNTVVATVPVGDLPFGITITPDGAFAYVANQFSNNVSVIATVSNTVVATVSVGNHPNGIAITPDGAFVYVANQNANTVSVIATAGNNVVAIVPVGSQPLQIAITPDGAFAYLTHSGSASVSVIATASNTVVTGVPVGGAPIGVAITPDGAFAYVADVSGNVAVIATASNTVMATVAAGGQPLLVAITSDGAFAYVTRGGGFGPGGGTGDVVVIDTASNTVVATITAGNNPTGIAITPAPSAPVNNPPVVTITGPASGSIFSVGTPVNFTGMFTDDAGDTHTGVWMFDTLTQAATIVEPSGSTPGSANAVFTFTQAGVYAVKLTVTDNGGLSGVATNVGEFDALVVIFDPNAGWVTGGGWINSPAGAYVPDPSLTGKANFGFVSKYLPGANVPTGNTEFHFKTAGFKFKSTSYEWMVVAGARAQYKGEGTINGAGSYRFMLTAIDGDQPGGGGTDKFRIRIWSDGGGLVYDNQLNAPDSDDPTTVLGGGSIQIHH